MITIKFNDIEATFSGERWKCDNKDVRKMLNDSFDMDEVTVSDTYRVSEYDKTVTGLDAMALDAVAFLKPEIVEYSQDLVPEEEEDVVI